MRDSASPHAEAGRAGGWGRRWLPLPSFSRLQDAAAAQAACRRNARRSAAAASQQRSTSGVAPRGP
jgi:hypothetical protein